MEDEMEQHKRIKSLEELFGERSEKIKPPPESVAPAVSTEPHVSNTSFEKYTGIYFDVTAKHDLAPTTALLLFTVCSLSKKNGYCFMGKTKLARLINISVPALYDHVKILEGKGLLIKIPQKFRTDTSKLKPTAYISEWVEKIKKSITDKHDYGKNKHKNF